MAVNAVTKASVQSALEQFRRTGLQAMLERYGGGPSTRWYVRVDHLLYDQKLVVRAAHVIQGLGDLSPRGPGSFDAGQARSLLVRLGYRVVPKLSQTNENLRGPSAVKPLARWLIGAARRSTTLTYGEAASRLENECGFSKLPRASRVGWTAGALQDAIHEHDPSAPLLNVLLVRKDTGLPGSRAGGFSPIGTQSRPGSRGGAPTRPIPTCGPATSGAPPTRPIDMLGGRLSMSNCSGRTSRIRSTLLGNAPEVVVAGRGRSTRHCASGCGNITSASTGAFAVSTQRPKWICSPVIVWMSSTAPRMRSSPSRSSLASRTGLTSSAGSISA